MAAIDRIEAGLYRITLPEPVSDSTHGVMTGFEIVTARVWDADGAEGLGYTYTCGRNGGAIHHILAHEIRDIVAGADADLIEALWQRVWWALHYGGRGGPSVLAQSAFDMALWDLKARRAGLPLYRLLGGHSARVSCYAGGIDLWTPLDALIAQTEANHAKGHRAIKMKVGRSNLAEDVERVAAMRAHLGDSAALMLDANMVYTPAAAVRAARAFASFAPVWFEEPIAPDHMADHARVARQGGLPIAAGENLRSLFDFRHLIASGGVDWPEPDVTNCGGVTAFLKIAHLAEAFGLPVTSHGAHDVTVHLLAAVPNGQYLEAHGFGLDRYIAHPLVIDDGFAVAAERPGHGLTFDWEALGAIRAN